MSELFSGARQGVRYRGNGGMGTLLLTEPKSNDEPGQMALFNDRSMRTVHPESVEYGHTATERKHDPTQWNGQQALRGMPKPTDPALHRLRQQNPHLNDYQFHGAAEKPRRISAYAGGKQVADIQLGFRRDPWMGEHAGHHEVEEIAVAPNHAGKGLGEAVYDLARMRGTKIVHSTERSESGEAFARRVGGPQFQRKRGMGQDDYLGIDPPRDKV